MKQQIIYYCVVFSVLDSECTQNANCSININILILFFLSPNYLYFISYFLTDISFHFQFVYKNCPGQEAYNVNESYQI